MNKNITNRNPSVRSHREYVALKATYSPEEAMWRRRIQGSTVRGGIGVLVADVATNTVLLFQRISGHDAGKWTCPGGKIDFGETARHAACRELNEETGLVVSPDDLVEMGTYDHIDVENHHHFVGPAFLYVLRGNDHPSNIEPHKHADMMMYDLDYVGRMSESLCDPTRGAIEMYKKLGDAVPTVEPWIPPVRTTQTDNTFPTGFYLCPLTGTLYGSTPDSTVVPTVATNS